MTYTAQQAKQTAYNNKSRLLRIIKSRAEQGDLGITLDYWIDDKESIFLEGLGYVVIKYRKIDSTGCPNQDITKIDWS